MKRFYLTRVTAFSLLGLASLFATIEPISAAEVKIGLITAYSGPYAEWGIAVKRTVELFLEQRKGKIAGHDITVLYRDDGGNPARAKQLAQELVTRDNVQYLGGGIFTPNSIAVGDVASQAKIPYVIFNGNASDLTRKFPYILRVSTTLWQLTDAMSKFAIAQGRKRAVIISADIAGGADTIAGYQKAYPALGGTIVDVIKFPMDTTNMSSYFQRVEDAKADALFTFVPNGPLSVALLKAYVERGLRAKGLEYFGLGETEEPALLALGQSGDLALGCYSALFYGPYAPDSDANKAFRSDLQSKYGKDVFPTQGDVQAWDGLQLIARMIEATDGKADGDKAMAAAKGYAWESPRGPISIDPIERDIIQNIYIRKVEKVDGMLINKQVDVIRDVKDPWKLANPAQ